MRKREELNDPRSCLSRARDDELLFVLLERDVASASTVRHWIRERIRLGKNTAIDGQILEAVRWADEVTYINLTDKQRGLLEHALGAKSDNPGYRNRYSCYMESDQWVDIVFLVEAGFMEFTGDASLKLKQLRVTDKCQDLLGIKEID